MMVIVGGDMPISPHLELLLQRKKIRASLVEWATFRHPERPPKQHHILMLNALQRLIDGTLVHPVTGKPCRKLIVKMPPGAGKSTYVSVDTPPWYLNRFPDHSILACSHNKDLIQGFSRQCRDSINFHSSTLGYSLSSDSHAIDEWRTTKGGLYFCAGVTAGVAGHRANFGLIDDYCGDEETAQSKSFRDGLWAWYENDFQPRLTNDERKGFLAIQAILATPRHEDDLIARLLDKFPNEWCVLKIPFFAKPNDPLGRPVGNLDSEESMVASRLWPEHFSEDDAREILKKSPRTISCLYDLEPHPEHGDYFRSDWFIPYTSPSQLPKQLRVYGAADFGISEERHANATCLGFGGMDSTGDIWLLPKLFWGKHGPKEIVGAWLRLLELYNPIEFWAEKGQISKSIGPFLKDMMLEAKIYVYIKEITPARDKETRAQTFRGLSSMGRVHVPTFTPWWPDALHELTTFPGGKTDDFVDFCAHLGAGINRMIRAPQLKQESEPEEINQPWKPTLRWLKKSDKATQKMADQYEGR